MDRRDSMILAFHAALVTGGQILYHIVFVISVVYRPDKFSSNGKAQIFLGFERSIVSSWDHHGVMRKKVDYEYFETVPSGS